MSLSVDVARHLVGIVDVAAHENGGGTSGRLIGRPAPRQPGHDPRGWHDPGGDLGRAIGEKRKSCVLRRAISS